MTKTKFLKPAVLSISLLTVLAGAAVSPALGQIKNAFPGESDLAIQMVLTLPPLLIIPFSLLSGRLALLFKKRHLLFVGLAIYALAGVGGGLVNSMPMLLFMRGLLGVGTGLIAPLSQALIADFFSGEERAAMMGNSSATATMGGIVMPLLSGWLAVYSWRYAFASYLVSLLVLLVVWRFLPEPPKSEKQENKYRDLPLSVFGMGLLTFLLMVVFYLIPTKVALFLQDQSIGDASQSGVVIATMNVAAFLMGLVFGNLRRLFKRFTPLFGLITLAIGLVVLYSAQQLWMVLAAVFVAGLGIGTLMPTLFTATANLVPNELNAPALSITNSSLYLGQFASPVIFSVVASVFAAQAQGVRFDFLTGGIMAGIAAVVFLLAILLKKRN